MRRLSYVLGVVCFFVSSLSCAGNVSITPNTTHQKQIMNNTSAAPNFISQSNGNIGGANISKVDIHSLLYPGATTKIYAHLMLWFGQSNHMNVGYSSVDPAQVKRQVADMISRGIDGVIIDWYGPNNWIDQATQVVMNEAEANPGFTFSIMVDQGALKWNSCSGCNPQDALLAQMRYVEQKYFTSSAYTRLNGKPMVTNFDIDLAYQIDWNALDSALATDPYFVFQNNNGFTHPASSGSDSWVMPTTTDDGMGYLTSFYQTGQSHPDKTTVGAAYKGFNDSLALWGSNRIMSQQCGQTWLSTFSKINHLYNSSHQLPVLQLTTWNDYEEGSEIETGIDNCLRVSVSLSGSALQWQVHGNENTVDHYQIYISRDGWNLMPLNQMAVGSRSLNLCSFSLSPAKYVLYVQAIGKPGLRNQTSGPGWYTPNCGK
jgi:hypothetical protein